MYKPGKGGRFDKREGKTSNHLIRPIFTHFQRNQNAKYKIGYDDDGNIDKIITDQYGRQESSRDTFEINNGF